MLIKIHKSYRHVVAICDSDLIGKKYEEGKKQLDIRENFYKGEEVDEKEAIRIMQAENIEDATFNIVGPESIKTALKAEVITEENIAKIDNVPFALKLI